MVKGPCNEQFNVYIRFPFNVLEYMMKNILLTICSDKM